MSPRPNKPRSVEAERNLARRITVERERRGWTYDGLAQRMADAGCPIPGSALFKIEKGDPPRRITVNEIAALSDVFAMPLSKLIVAPEDDLPTEVADLAERIVIATAVAKAANDAANRASADRRALLDEFNELMLKIGPGVTPDQIRAWVGENEDTNAQTRDLLPAMDETIDMAMKRAKAQARRSRASVKK